MTKGHQILIAEPDRMSTNALAILGRLGTLQFADDGGVSLAADQLAKATVLWLRLRHRITAQVMKDAPHLKFIVTPTTGLDHIDMAEAERKGIKVLSLRGEARFLSDVRATAEHTISLMLALLRSLPAGFAHVRQGGWNRDLFWGNELYQKTVGIVGFGRLGRLVSKYLLAFGSKVITADPHVSSAEIPTEATLMPLEKLLNTADIVTLHVNLNGDTAGFFGPKQFANMKTGAWFINTARGDLVDESALLHSLESGRLAGAALDVLKGEQAGGMAAHPLVAYAQSHHNLIITPHLGGCTFESIEKTEVFMAEKLAACLNENVVADQQCAA